MIEVFSALSRYNRWMNQKVYAVAAGLREEDRKKNLGAFFCSIHGTLSHLLLADRIWLSRFGALERPPFKSMSDELYVDFAVLRQERVKTDDDIDRFVAELTAERLASSLAYDTSRSAVEHPLWFAVLHLFNHQTHHRGQLTTLLSQLGRDPGVTDLVALLREEQVQTNKP